MKYVVITLLVLLCSLIVVDKSYKEVYYNDKDALAALINSECGNCSITEQYLVGSVVLNRLCDSSYPPTIRQVIRQQGQFHGYKTKHYKPTKKTRKVADDLLNNLYLTPDIKFFCTKKSERPMDRVLITGEHHLFGI